MKKIINNKNHYLQRDKLAAADKTVPYELKARKYGIQAEDEFLTKEQIDVHWYSSTIKKKNV